MSAEANLTDQVKAGCNKGFRKKAKQPFRLSVKVAAAVGKSIIPSAYPYECVQPITEKFYSKYQWRRNITPEDLQQFHSKYITGPREKYTQPVLESHQYGWFHDIRFDRNMDYYTMLKQYPNKT